MRPMTRRPSRENDTRPDFTPAGQAPEWRASDRQWLAAMAIFFGCALFLAWPWLSGAVTLPWDGKAHFQAQAAFLARSIHAGESPFWAPYVFSGHPQIADPQSLIFNPGFLLLALLTPAPSFAMVDGVAFGSLVFGALAIFGFARDRRWHPAAALVAALAFAFGGAAGWRIQHVGQVLSLAYFPWAFWMLDRALRLSSVRFGALAGLFAGLMVLGPDQVAFLGVICLAGFTLAHLVAGPSRLASLRASLRPLAAGALAGGAVIALPILMVLSFADGSNRAQISLAEAAIGSLHPTNLLTFVVANLFGTIGPGPDFWGAPSVHWPYIVNSNVARNMANAYTGLLPLAGILVWFACPAAYRSRMVALPILFGLMIAYALGRYTPVFPVAYHLLPGVDLFRRPADALFLVGAVGAFMAGFGLDRVLKGGMGRWPGGAAALWLGAALLALAGGFAMALWLGKLGQAAPELLATTGWLALAAGVLVVARRHARVRPVLVAALMALAVTADLRWNLRPNDSTGLDPALYNELRADSDNETLAWLKTHVVRDGQRRDRVELAGLGFGWPNAGLVHGLENVLGYNPLRIAAYSAATGAQDHVANPDQRRFSPLMPGYQSPLADLLGLRWIVTGVPIERIDPSLAQAPPSPVARTKDGFIYENASALPRVMVVPEARPLDQDRLIRTGEWPSTDFQKVVYVEPVAETLPRNGPGGTARLTRYGHTMIDVAVEAPGGGMLVLNDVWHPWWVAEIDNVPARILRANGIFRAVILPAGAKRVTFRFEPLRGLIRSVLAKRGLAGAP
ncbi:MAG: hypothetical protein O9322_03035 [Beijerinckiaceae bacterium]|nr:hypothetical protein [Beijerinckiaceae bacterium]MCZ8301539.1 hypothetical protein [Beijerinckiaceae bacterium]